MVTTVCELDKRTKGSLAETEDWWRLMREQDGSYFVEHQWSHTKLKSLTTDAGEQKIAIDDFLASDEPAASKARAKLQAMRDGGEI